MAIATSQYRIGELAERAGRGVHAIRWYETQGLIPGVTRDKGGRRVYNEQHLGWLQFMDYLRSTGMTIAEMRQYTALARQGRVTLKQRKELLSLHRMRVEETIVAWMDALKLIDSKIAFYDEWAASGHRPKYEPLERSGVVLDRQVKGSLRRIARKKT
jgi:DNA-binding transcriptional MerR regulator